MTRQEALEKLKQFKIEGEHVYLIDFIPLIEMIWADGHAQDSEVTLLGQYLHQHVALVNEHAGYEVLRLTEAQKFVGYFIKIRPAPELMRALRELIAPVRLSNTDEEMNRAIKESLLCACIDIASSAVSTYPYDLNERFNKEEKLCFFEILDTFEKAGKTG